MIGTTGLIAMMLSSMFGTSVGGYSIEKIASAIKWILITILLAVVTWFVYSKVTEYQSMASKITEYEQAVKNKDQELKQLRATNTDLEKQLKLKEESGKIDTESVSNLADKNEQTKDTFSEIEKERKQKEETVKKTPVKKVKNKDASTGKVVVKEVPLTAEELQKQISEIRIDSIWKAYCSSNKPNEKDANQCKVVLQA